MTRIPFYIGSQVRPLWGNDKKNEQTKTCGSLWEDSSRPKEKQVQGPLGGHVLNAVQWMRGQVLKISRK